MIGPHGPSQKIAPCPKRIIWPSLPFYRLSPSKLLAQAHSLLSCYFPRDSAFTPLFPDLIIGGVPDADMSLSTEAVVAIVSLLVTCVPGFYILHVVCIIKGRRAGHAQHRRSHTETFIPLRQHVCDASFVYGFLYTHTLSLSRSVSAAGRPYKGLMARRKQNEKHLLLSPPDGNQMR